ncbi:N-acetyl-gamma-glutamyl-phosphate reductase [Selenomonas sp. oral taxon 138]|uniref:N-acetyl-gamma-glutamyl-phosphate reductase n=1 Tax=Selenomonas sp. oral taxon 138 TaxID=712532 RepID=UPI0002A21652|nr:N-acetyl-gamma-glutamyl-phosphate reductase [Selenomonas sp. oral taxon 138]EKX98926.1 N-acetyl-gamma-glutamyl-phosphate reductase [Selenomonas sp. oral taxon 138 str. F0429]
MKASIIGASGYAGEELIRLLHGHPNVEIAHLTSERHTGERISTLYSHLLNIYNKELESMEDVRSIAADSDVLFIALPHGHAMKIAKSVSDLPLRIIDLGADYRFADTSVYEAWYHVDHIDPDADRAYGLAELYRDQVRSAHIIGNAGCYTTASILALAPLVKARLVQMDSILVDAVSGVSGAGRTPKESTHFPEFYDSFTAYGAVSHRHTPEIEQALSNVGGAAVTINFTPHLAPISRGILATCYAKMNEGVTPEQIDATFAEMYADEFFIRLLGRGAYPATKYVRGTNFCDIAWHIDPRTQRVIVFSAIDNLVKGAAGQAIQNMNIAFGLDERAGLDLVPMYP